MVTIIFNCFEINCHNIKCILIYIREKKNSTETFTCLLNITNEKMLVVYGVKQSYCILYVDELSKIINDMHDICYSQCLPSTLGHPTHDMTWVYFRVTRNTQITLSDTRLYQISGIQYI